MHELSFDLTECKGEIELVCWHDEERYSRESVESWLDTYSSILNVMASDTESGIGSLEVISIAQREVLMEWNDTATDYPADAPIHELFEAQAAVRPTRLR